MSLSTFWKIGSPAKTWNYTAETFTAKARHSLSLSPPDLVDTAEQVWLAAVYAVKMLYLTCGGIDSKSHNSLKYFCGFSNYQAAPSWERFDYSFECWTKAEMMYQDLYGSSDFHARQYAQIISDLENFMQALAKFDRKKIWNEFNRTFIAESYPSVEVGIVSDSVNLGGFSLRRKYVVFA